MYAFCPRKYWHRYIGHWFGWTDHAHERTRLNYRLTKLESIPTWIGKRVHSGISSYLSGDLDIDIVRSRTLELMQSEFKVSEGPVRGPKLFKLQEHFYDTISGRSELEEAQTRVAEALDAFLKTGYRTDFEKARSAGRFTFKEDDLRTWPDRELFLPELGMDLESVPIYANPDCVFQHKDDGFVILDWKTGRQPGAEDRQVITPQLALYVLWLRHRHAGAGECPPDRIEAYECYLPEDELFGRALSEDDLQRTVRQTRNEILKLRKLSDHERYNIVPEKRCEAKSGQATCGSCPFRFREVCRDSAI